MNKLELTNTIEEKEILLKSLSNEIFLAKKTFENELTFKLREFLSLENIVVNYSNNTFRKGSSYEVALEVEDQHSWGDRLLVIEEDLIQLNSFGTSFKLRHSDETISNYDCECLESFEALGHIAKYINEKGIDTFKELYEDFESIKQNGFYQLEKALRDLEIELSEIKKELRLLIREEQDKVILDLFGEDHEKYLISSKTLVNFKDTKAFKISKVTDKTITISYMSYGRCGENTVRYKRDKFMHLIKPILMNPISYSVYNGVLTKNFEFISYDEIENHSFPVLKKSSTETYQGDIEELLKQNPQWKVL